ncbi:type I restriction enzyme M protein [Trichlorobacter thiogenes]|uniref:site-specific DNA-methyltransferase (adenine-specific) n=1 Tax=Trichlorobacter thiogenes TaxID=115783 RepID=A0A1T4S9I2_9BACT|nr:type I restriction-modification system subunit M [Trichlorobacter thiogenes]SKA24852.1 type I restriction enzyme M protein [Trichlorobacter thiogenes]
MNKQQLAAKIWESANQMRSKIEANEYKDYILGFIFYKYLSDNLLKFAKKEGCSEDDIKALSEDDAETVEYFKSNIGYFIAHNDLFSTWISLGRDFDVSNVRDALSAFSRLINPAHRKLFDGIFKTLETGLSKLGDSAASQTKAISNLLQLIKDIPMDGRQDYDVLGFIYEYLIGMFAANAGKKAGEFYTPHEVSLLMSEIVAHHLKDRNEIQIYDPTSGSGSLLINIGRCVSRQMLDANSIKYYAQELKQNTYNLTRMNLIMRGILVDNIVTRNGDTLEDDWPYFDETDPTHSYNPLYVDAVVSNPPYSQKWDSSDKESDPRYARFGLAPKSKADYAFLLHELFHLKPDGIMTIVLPHGVLFRGGEEGEIRKKLIEGNHIDAIIGLPSNIFFGTSIPTVIMVLRQRRDQTDTLIIDASKGFEKVGKNNKLRASDIKRIADTVLSRSDRPTYSRRVPREEIRSNSYNLNIPRYVDAAESAESWDIHAAMFGGIPQSEIDLLAPYWEALPGLRDTLFASLDGPYASLQVVDLKQAITEHAAVAEFNNRFATAFQGFDQLLKQRLLDQMESISIVQEETVLGDDIFRRLATVPLIDPYSAYQALDDEWGKISVDLEIIQTEGFSATRKVDPNMVIKKKDGKDHELQDGWIGRVIPFSLVQQTLLVHEYEALQKLDRQIIAIAAELEEQFEGFSEEEKDADCFNEEKDGFVATELAKEAKQLRSDSKKGETFGEESYEARIIKADDLLKAEKELKKQRKLAADALHLKTKATIEGLSDPQVYDLLERKWIHPLLAALYQQPRTEIAFLIARVTTLAEKYATTYKGVVEQMQATQQSLSALIDELTGNEFDLQGLAEFQQLLRGE